MSVISKARWPEGTIIGGPDVTSDTHETFEQAQAVCLLLKREGFGGERKVFPVATWVENDSEYVDVSTARTR